MFASNIMGKNLDDPSFEPVWATAEELGAFMFVHPNNVAGADRLKSYYLQNLIGNPLDTTIAAACLYFGGVLDRHPKLTFMLAHGGGFTPYQAARWEHGWAVRPEPKKNISKQPKNIAKRFYYDTILHSAPVLEFMIGHVGADRVMLGSDYPYDMAMLDCVKHVRGLKISDADKATILGGHAGTAAVGETMNVQAAKAARIPMAAVTGLIVDAMTKAGVSERRRRQDRRADAGSRSHRRRRARRVPAAAIRPAAETRLDQSAPEYHGEAQRAGDRAGRWRQRHGPSGRRARGGDRDRTRA